MAQLLLRICLKVSYYESPRSKNKQLPRPLLLTNLHVRGCIKKYVDFNYNFKTTQRKSIKFCTRIKQLNVKRIIGFTLMYYTCV